MTDNQDTRSYAGPIEIDYWNVDQRHYEDKLALLRDHSKEELVTAIVSYHYNAFCRDHADAKDNEKGEQDTGKRIP